MVLLLEGLCIWIPLHPHCVWDLQAPGDYHRRGVVSAYARWDDFLMMSVVLFLGQGLSHGWMCLCLLGKEDIPNSCLRDLSF